MIVHDESRSVQSKLVIIIHKFFIHRNTYNFCDEHVMGRILVNLHNFALQIDRRFGYGWALHLLACSRSKAGLLKLVKFAAGSDTAEVSGFGKIFSCQIDYKFTGFFYDIV